MNRHQRLKYSFKNYLLFQSLLKSGKIILDQDNGIAIIRLSIKVQHYQRLIANLRQIDSVMSADPALFDTKLLRLNVRLNTTDTNEIIRVLNQLPVTPNPPRRRKREMPPHITDKETTKKQK